MSSLGCPRCGGEHGVFRDVIACIMQDQMSTEDAHRAVDRVAERLGGATHEEAMEKYPPCE